jgi:uncharacterized membrane protein YbhN (UPF0104 family)
MPLSFESAFALGGVWRSPGSRLCPDAGSNCSPKRLHGSNRVMSKQTVFWLLKLCLGLGLLSWLVVEADYHAVLRQLRSVDLAWLAAVFVVPHIGLLLSTIKWQALLTCLGSHVGIAPLFKFYLIGTFFNNFLPSMVGGDIVRIYLLQRLALTTERAIASTFIERFIGFGGMMTLLPLVWLYPSVTRLRFTSVCSCCCFHHPPFSRIVRRNAHLSNK